MVRIMQLPATPEPTDKEVDAVHEFLGDADWESDYDSGVAINTPDGPLRVNPGDWMVCDADGWHVFAGSSGEGIAFERAVGPLGTRDD